MSFEKISDISSIDNKRNISEKYNHLFEMGDRVEQMKKKEIYALLVQILAESRELQSGRRYNYLETRRLEQDNQAVLSAEKASAMVKTLSLVMGTTSVLLSIGAAATGAGMAYGICQSLAQASNIGSDHYKKITDAEVEVLNHAYQRKGALVGDYASQIQSTDSEWRKDAEAIDRMMQTQQRLAEMIVGG